MPIEFAAPVATQHQPGRRLVQLQFIHQQAHTKSHFLKTGDRYKACRKYAVVNSNICTGQVCRIADIRAALHEYHFLFIFQPPSQMAAKKTAAAKLEEKQEVMLTKCTLIVYSFGSCTCTWQFIPI